MTPFELPAVADLIRTALAEDVGRGDVTTRLTVPRGAGAHGTLLAKQDGVLAGLPLVARVFDALGGGVTVQALATDGDAFSAGTKLATVEGPAATVLIGERLALNLVQQLSGVATLTRQYVDAVRGTKARIIDTRKTTPGLRALEKYAVRMGGGGNHRAGLDDGILIKDNHLVAAGGVAAAVGAARAGAPHGLRIEVECATLAQVDQALAAGADALLLDNMAPDQMAEAVRRIAGRALVEASGGVTLATVRAIAETGVDLISVGAL
ncbi:MAG: carboxylating nicotinate-nucleotide diphosphorylase, partial [Deltaproteobacteria bacterium]|nr:carboxylating nicotinate-nucleotide diphosphorylase [Deltaproteobacteria bacterium]